METTTHLLSQAPFELFGWAHCLAILTTVIAAVGLSIYLRKNSNVK
mgnify:CR=1 FL=1